MPESSLHFSNDCPNCHGVGYLALSYSEDFPSASAPICTWCNTSTRASAPKWIGGLPTPSVTSTSPPSALNSPCYPLQPHNQTGSWNLVHPLGRSPAIPPYQMDNRSHPNSPGSAADLSPSQYSEAKGYFDFIPIRSAAQAPISPGSVAGSDNDLLGDMASLNGSCSRTQNQRDSKARCLKKLDNAMEKLIGLLPPEMQLSCKRGRANGLKLVEDYISRIVAENDKLRSEARKTSNEKDRVVNENQQLRDEIAQLRLAFQNQYR